MALSTIKTAYRLDAGSPEILDVYIGTLVDLGQQAVSEDKHHDAMIYFESAESLSPQNTDVLRPMADLYFQQGELDKAGDIYERINTIISDSTVTKRLAEIEKRSQDAASLFEKGLKAYKNGRFKTSKSFCNKALQVKVDLTVARYLLLMADGRLHVKRATKKSYWDAIDAFGKAAGFRSDAAEPHFRMAQAYEKKDPDEFVNAIDAYEMALKLEPDGAFAKVCKKKIKELKTRKEKLDKFWGRKK
jgi:tetratricopeptide (TPR) repeat protein